MSTLSLMTGALMASLLIFAITWAWCIRIGNAAWVDAVWAYAIGLLACSYWLIAGVGCGAMPLASLLTLIWSVRLGSHLTLRLLREKEDGRYRTLNTLWGGPASLGFAAFFLIQALAAWFFSLPALYLTTLASTPSTLQMTLAILLALISVAGESIADRQLAAFRREPTRKGLVCRQGLWRYSRHPNYFFEWVFWICFPVLAWGTQAFVPTLSAPIVMYLMITRFTGIPPTEAQALKSRGMRYRTYQQETSSFFPWFPRKPTHQTQTKDPA
jgi:steroid 5-alpha reductase family enzyme